MMFRSRVWSLAPYCKRNSLTMPLSLWLSDSVLKIKLPLGADFHSQPFFYSQTLLKNYGTLK